MSDVMFVRLYLSGVRRLRPMGWSEDWWSFGSMLKYDVDGLVCHASAWVLAPVMASGFEYAPGTAGLVHSGSPAR